MNMLRTLKEYVLKNKFIALIGGVAILFALTLNWPGGCITPKEKNPVPGTQGYRIWFGNDIQSFNHERRKICIPEGWAPVGALEVTDTWARFDKRYTGILIRTEAFKEKELAFEHSNFLVRMLYPKAIPEERLLDFENQIKHSFESAGAVFNDDAHIERTRHTVLVTAGIEGLYPNETLIYPDPRPEVTILINDPRSPRGEELFMHAVMHLYNRFRDVSNDYKKHQSPLQAGDIEELEATWAETAFRSNSEGRTSRLEYLYTVHRAVQSKNFSLITEPPFNSEKEFNSIVPSVLVTKNSSDITVQYAHYVLGPLVMVALEGLLQENGALTDMRAILQKIHGNQSLNIFDELRRFIPETEMLEVEEWMLENKLIPKELIDKGSAYYDSL